MLFLQYQKILTTLFSSKLQIYKILLYIFFYVNDKSVAFHLFLSYFNTIYVLPLLNNFSTSFSFHNLPNNYLFNIDDVEAGLDALKNMKSVGPDGLSSIFLYSVKSSLCFPLRLLYRRFIETRTFQTSFEICFITPIF